MEINIQNIWFSHGETPIIKDLSHRFSPGKFHGILGPNGSGKTTLLDLISGFMPLTREKFSWMRPNFPYYRKTRLPKPSPWSPRIITSIFLSQWRRW